MTNPYFKQQRSMDEFLFEAYSLMKRKIYNLISIENGRKRGKISLPKTKEKFEETSKLLEALRVMISGLDFENKIAQELANYYNNIGMYVSKGNIDSGDDAIKNYNQAIKIIDSLLYE
jgi:hypothetical protein